MPERDGSRASTALVDAALERLGPVVVRGLDAGRAEWALSALRDTVLPTKLDFGPEPSDEERRRWAARIVDDMSTELAEVDPGERLAALTIAIHSSRVDPLSGTAFDLARRRLVSGESSQLAEEARPLLAKLEDLRAETKREAPEALDALALEFSEAIMDCRYAIEDGPFVSLRLGRLMTDVDSMAEEAGSDG